MSYIGRGTFGSDCITVFLEMNVKFELLVVVQFCMCLHAYESMM